MPIIRLAAAASFCMLAASAWAGSSASATLGPVTIQLVDIDPLDGITPWVTFGPPASLANAMVTSSTGGLVTDSHAGTSAWGDTSAGATMALLESFASIGGAAADGAGAVLSAHGSASDFVGLRGEVAAYQAGASASELLAPPGTFTLSPATSLTISGWAVAQASTTKNSAADHELAIGSMALYLAGPGGSAISTDGLEASCDGVATVPCTSSQSRMLTVTYANATATSVTGQMQVAVLVSGSTYANVVPEPGSAGLLLAGLAVLGGRARRRRRTASQGKHCGPRASRRHAVVT